jgi:hypothetical protein
LKKEKSLCRRVRKDKGAVGEEPVREEEGVADADLRIVSAPAAESERRINQTSRAMSRNAQNAGELCEESKLTSVPRVPLKIFAARDVARSL